jgi:hypothetical protein
LQKFELISVKCCQSDIFRQAATPPALQRAGAHARAVPPPWHPSPPVPSRGCLFPRPGALRGALKSSPATCRVFPRRSATPPWTAGPFSAALPARAYNVLPMVRTPPFTLLCVAKRPHSRYKRGTAGRPRAPAVMRPEPLRWRHWRLPRRTRVLTSRVPNRDPLHLPLRLL